VLTPINLYDQHSFVANKVEDERTDWNLTAEAQSVQSMRSQPGPQPMLGIRHVVA
jgi:hypothetical protein